MANSIMIVDDDPICLKICNSILAKEGYSVIPVGSGKTAIKMFANAQPALILMDMEMPERSGSETMQLIRALESANGLSKTPALFLSGNDYSEAEADIERCHMEGLISKPVTPDRLVETVKKYLQ